MSKGLLEEFKGNAQVKVIVTYHGKICMNKPHTLDINFRTHGYEEADTQNPLHVLHSLKDNIYKHFDIYSVVAVQTSVLVTRIGYHVHHFVHAQTFALIEIS